MNEPTPKPWYRIGAVVYALNARGCNRWQARVEAAGFDCATDQECMQNAQLMAAAPDLLEALQNLMGIYDTPLARRKDDSEFAQEARQIAREALERATGKKP